jgi:hypothetical protein
MNTSPWCSTNGTTGALTATHLPGGRLHRPRGGLGPRLRTPSGLQGIEWSCQLPPDHRSAVILWLTRWGQCEH